MHLSGGRAPAPRLLASSQEILRVLRIETHSSKFLPGLDLGLPSQTAVSQGALSNVWEEHHLKNRTSHVGSSGSVPFSELQFPPVQNRAVQVWQSWQQHPGFLTPSLVLSLLYQPVASNRYRMSTNLAITNRSRAKGSIEHLKVLCVSGD